MLKWKEQYRGFPVNEETFSTLHEMLSFTVQNGNCATSIREVSGICYNPSCQNTYTKTFNSIVKKGGPFCKPCLLGKKARVGVLLHKEYPDVYAQLVDKSEKDLLLTCGSHQQRRWLCPETCSRCLSHHKYKCCVYDKVAGVRCGVCAGYQTCDCQADDEFRCPTCKIIKKKDEMVKVSKSIKSCKKCVRKCHDGNVPKFLTWMCSHIKERGRKQPWKNGDQIGRAHV